MSDPKGAVILQDSEGMPWAVTDCDDYPLDSDGNECKCVRHPADHTIQIAGFISGSERPELLAKALGNYRPNAEHPWRLVPLRPTSAALVSLAYVLHAVSFLPLLS